jgi:hypothetical protein
MASPKEEIVRLNELEKKKKRKMKILTRRLPVDVVTGCCIVQTYHYRMEGRYVRLAKKEAKRLPHRV